MKNIFIILSLLIIGLTGCVSKSKLCRKIKKVEYADSTGSSYTIYNPPTLLFDPVFKIMKIASKTDTLFCIYASALGLVEDYNGQGISVTFKDNTILNFPAAAINSYHLHKQPYFEVGTTVEISKSYLQKFKTTKIKIYSFSNGPTLYPFAFLDNFKARLMAYATCIETIQ